MRTANITAKTNYVKDIKSLMKSAGLNSDLYRVVRKPVKHESGHFKVMLQVNNDFTEERKFVNYMSSTRDFYFSDWDFKYV